MKVTIAVLPFALLVLSARGDTRTLDATDEDLYAVPADLLIGAGVSAFQTEGAWNEDGKAESAVDHLFREGDLSSVGVTDRHLQDTAANSYRMYKDDIKMAAELKLKLVRFSLSWSRILPTADASKPNQLGVDYYKSYISEILKYNMTPVATLYHFDHPQILEDQFHGWQSPQMVDKFKEYAEFVFKEFGAMVPFWATLNEPNMYCVYFPGMFLKVGFYKASDEDWYSCIRHVILANAAAYHAFKDAGLQGKIGFTAVLFKGNPVTTNAEDVYAANVYNSLQSGIILDPVIHGDYSQTAKDVLGDHLTPFTEEEKKRIKGTSDFLGLNIYYGGTVEFLRPNESSSDQIPSSSCPVYSMPFYTTHPNFTGINYGMMRESLLWAWNNYRVPLLVTESGIGDDTLSPAYHSENLRALVKTMKEFQVKVIGYAAWSLIDAFEFTSGFKKSFGLVHVDYQNGTLARSHKKSSEFWIQLGETGIVPLVKEPSSASSAICVSASILLFSASSVLSFLMF